MRASFKSGLDRVTVDVQLSIRILRSVLRYFKLYLILLVLSLLATLLLASYFTSLGSARLAYERPFTDEFRHDLFWVSLIEICACAISVFPVVRYHYGHNWFWRASYEEMGEDTEENLHGGIMEILGLVGLTLLIVHFSVAG